MYAALRGQPSWAETLISEGVEIEDRCKMGYTALSWGAWGGHANVVKVLVDNGANVNVCGECWNTPLMDAATWDYLEVAKVLLKAFADTGRKNKLGLTAYDLAIKRDNLEMAYLINKKIIIDNYF